MDDPTKSTCPSSETAVALVHLGSLSIPKFEDGRESLCSEAERPHQTSPLLCNIDNCHLDYLTLHEAAVMCERNINAARLRYPIPLRRRVIHLHLRCFKARAPGSCPPCVTARMTARLQTLAVAGSSIAGAFSHCWFLLCWTLVTDAK